MPAVGETTPIRAAVAGLPYAYPDAGRRAVLRIAQAAMVIGAVAVVALFGTAGVRWMLVDIDPGSVAAWGTAVLSWLVLLGLLVDEARTVRADRAGVVVHVRTTRTEIPWASIARVVHTTTLLVVETVDGARHEFAFVSDARRGDVAMSTTPTAQLAADLEVLRRLAPTGDGARAEVVVRSRQPSVAAVVLLVVAGLLLAVTALLCTLPPVQ
ncbi:hypothetical protein [Cellulosimicrobium sp. NPDC055967]|uniref:hypothetical protein n=1 Tax=Cellulosimicrobium sp. NPDC055967 TaxID=3345670 RepID=UPI0035DF2B0B